MSEPTSDLLRDWRQTYENRRTVPYEMVRALEGIVDSALKTQRSEHEAEVGRLTERHKAEVAQMNERIEGLRSTVTMQNELLAKLDAPLNEKRTLDEDTVQVTIDRRSGGWQLADLEDVAYRLRCGGGADNTPIDWREYSVRANVAAPNLVPLHRPGTQQPIRLKEPQLDYNDSNKSKPNAFWKTVIRLADHPYLFLLVGLLILWVGTKFG